MKIWKIILGFLGMVGALFAAGAAKSKEVKVLEGVIKENKKKEKEVEKEIKVLEENKKKEKEVVKKIEKLQVHKNKNKKEITNMKRKLTIHKKEVEKMETAYENDDVEDAAEFLRKFSESK